MKSLKCKIIDASICNGTFTICRLRPTRDGIGLTSVIHNFRKPLSDIWMQVTPFFKYGTIFRKWLMEVTVDVCAGAENLNDIPLIGRLLARSLEEQVPGFLHKCPYKGEEGFRNVSVDAVFSAMFPQIIPKGEYKIVFRAHTKKNVTFATAYLNFVLDANDPMKSMQNG